MTFGKRLQALRRQKKLTQGDVAQALGVPRTTYASWESDYRFPEDEKDMLAKLARYFETDIDYLITGRTDVREPKPHRGISPSDLDKLLQELPPEERENARNAIFRAGKELSPKGWRSVIDFIKWQLSQEEGGK